MPHDKQIGGVEFRENFVSTKKCPKSKLTADLLVLTLVGRD